MELTVYTCVTGDIRDEFDIMLASKPKPEDGVEYVYITDRIEPQEQRHPQGTVPWRVVAPSWTHPVSGRRTARWHKLNSHLLFPRSKYTMWLDGAFQINTGVSPLELARKFLAEHHLAAFRHPDRSCVYQEFDACVRLKKDDPDVMRAQIERYKFEGYPPYNGLVETACVCRRNSPEVRSFNELWWQQIEQGSLRDQLSFNYAAWKLGMTWDEMEGRRDLSPYFTFHPHK